jgi:hypothetical protein
MGLLPIQAVVSDIGGVLEDNPWHGLAGTLGPAPIIEGP